MGEGLVLQSGTHSELLKDQDGPYARLVSTQRIREQENEASAPGKSNIAEFIAEKSSEAHGTFPITIAANNTARIVQGVKSENADAHNRGMSYVFGRMIYINRKDWIKYTVGVIAASLTGLIYPGGS